MNEKERLQLIEDNMALVNFAMKKYHTVEPARYEDIFQEGCIGLIRASKTWNKNRGEFSTWAILNINHSIWQLNRTANAKRRVNPHGVDSSLEFLVTDGEGGATEVIELIEDKMPDIGVNVELYDILDQLEEKDKKLLILWWIEGYKQEEIAKMYDTSQRIICTRLQKALQRAQNIANRKGTIE